MDDRRLHQRRAQVSLTFEVSNSTEDSNATAFNATASAPASTAASSATAKERVIFNICPDTELSFKDTFSLIESMPPIRLETPARHPIDIICLQADTGKEDNLTMATPQTTSMTKGGNCVMSGGDVHILIEHVPHAVDALPATLTAEKEDHPINIVGITFRGASNSSILMNDPRSNITFKACSWEDNDGEATMIIDGRYVAPTTDDGSDGETLEPLYPDEPTSPPVDDGTDDLIIEYDNPEDMTVSFESTSTSSTMSFDQITSTVANESDDDNFTPEVQSKADKNPGEDDSVVEVEQSFTSSTIVSDAEAVTAETSLATTSDLVGFDFGTRRLRLPDDGSIEEDDGLSSIIGIGDREEGGTSMRAMQSLEMEEVALRSKISVEGCSFRVSLSGVTLRMFVVISSSTDNSSRDEILNVCMEHRAAGAMPPYYYLPTSGKRNSRRKKRMRIC